MAGDTSTRSGDHFGSDTADGYLRSSARGWGWSLDTRVYYVGMRCARSE